MSKNKENIILKWTEEETQEKTHQIYQGSGNRTFYEILGISENANSDQIKEAYKTSPNKIDSIVVSKTFKLTGKDYIKILTENPQAKKDYDNALKALREDNQIPPLNKEEEEEKRKAYTQTLSKKSLTIDTKNKSNNPKESSPSPTSVVRNQSIDNVLTVYTKNKSNNEINNETHIVNKIIDLRNQHRQDMAFKAKDSSLRTWFAGRDKDGLTKHEQATKKAMLELLNKKETITITKISKHLAKTRGESNQR